MSLDDVIKRVRIDCDNYNQTVEALKALANELLWHDSKEVLVSDGRAYFGRKMQTSPRNRISPNQQVTPDLVVLRSKDVNYVIEAKLALSKDADKRQPALIKLQRYDDHLIGWDVDENRSLRHDLILLVHFFHGVNVRNQIHELTTQDELKFERNFALVTFHRVEEVETWISLELLDGTLSDNQKQKKLSQRDKPVSLDLIVTNPKFGHIVLYDHRPPPPLLMNYIHETILADLSEDQNLELIESGQVEQQIHISELQKTLADSFGPGQPDARTPEIPQKSWVRDAMGLFARLNWARRIDRNKYTYIVKQRRTPFEQFVRLWAKEISKTEEMRAKAIAKEKAKMPLFKDLIERERSKKY